ncbi:MAG: winged helix-turn-helix domain-containing protein [Candidatus Bathyarchaeia archaeon]
MQPSLLQKCKKYRGHFEIITLILKAARNRYVTRFSIAKYAKVNYVQLKKYLRFLVETRFIKVHLIDGRLFYTTSVEGVNFLKQYDILLDMFSNVQRANDSLKTANIQLVKQGTSCARLKRWR